MSNDDDSSDTDDDTTGAHGSQPRQRAHRVDTTDDSTAGAYDNSNTLHTDQPTSKTCISDPDDGHGENDPAGASGSNQSSRYTRGSNRDPGDDSDNYSQDSHTNDPHGDNGDDPQPTPTSTTPPTEAAEPSAADSGAKGKKPKRPQRERELTPKQEAFVREYLSNGHNATAAYRIAYDASTMSEAQTNVEACLLVQNQKIAKRIAAAKQEIAQKTTFSASRVLNHLAEIAFSSPWTPDSPELPRYSDKLKAMELLGKHLGLFRENNVTLTQVTLNFNF